MTMGIISWIILGLIAGFIAKAIMPGKDPGGILITICLGIAGSFLATFLGRAMGLYAPDASAGFIASVIGAIVLLAIYHAVRNRRTA